MNNLATQNQNDITITESGDAYISNRKLATLIDVPESTLRDYFRAANIVISQGVSYEYLPKAAHNFAAKGNKTALEFVLKLSEAGAKAYLYHEAGYIMKAEKQMSPMEMVIASAQAIMKIEAQQAEQAIRITNVESTLSRLTGESSYMAILAWAIKNEMKIPLSKAQSMGKQAKAHCILKGIEYGSVKDERFNVVNTYPEEVLDLLFKPVA